MRKSLFLLLCAVLCGCGAKQDASAQNERKGGGGGDVAAAASQEGKAGGDAAAGVGKTPANTNLPTLFPVKSDGKYGYMDKSGKLVIKPQFSGASRFSEGLAAVQMEKAGRVGFINETGNMVIPLQFDLADPFSEGLAGFMKDHMWGFIDHTGQIVIPAKFGAVTRFSQGMAVAGSAVNTAVGFIYINKKGEPVNDTRFELAMPFGESIAGVRTMGQMIRYVDQSFKTVIEPKFMSAGEFAEGVAPAQVRMPDGMRWGYIAKDGKMTIQAHYFEAMPFSEGLAGVKLPTGKWGFIDKKDTTVIAAKYDSVSPFSNGLAQVFVGEAIGYIDPAGKYVWEPK